MTLLGGAVRLTQSGLAITDWQPILGAIPPLSDRAWAEAFTAYQQIPQYEALFPNMTLAEFKTIYWWEWSHRFLGRVIGFVFLIPLVIFYARGWLARAELGLLSAIFVLGALQAVIGWLMVQSGLSARVDVAPQRLALHFGLAMIIYGGVVLLLSRFYQRRFAPSGVALTLAVLVFVQLILGAMVAGAKAGMIHNHWLWPSDANLSLDAANPILWQVAHRLWGALLWVVGLCFLHLDRASPKSILLALALTFQVVLGLLTLISSVFLPLALLHQLGGIACWTLALLLLTESAKNR